MELKVSWVLRCGAFIETLWREMSRLETRGATLFQLSRWSISDRLSLRYIRNRNLVEGISKANMDFDGLLGSSLRDNHSLGPQPTPEGGFIQSGPKRLLVEGVKLTCRFWWRRRLTLERIRVKPLWSLFHYFNFFYHDF